MQERFREKLQSGSTYLQCGVSWASSAGELTQHNISMSVWKYKKLLFQFSFLKFDLGTIIYIWIQKPF